MKRTHLRCKSRRRRGGAKSRKPHTHARTHILPTRTRRVLSGESSTSFRYASGVHRRLRPCNAKRDVKSILTENFMEMLNEVKIYHWNTHSYAQHKATDELYSQLNEHIDKFVEVMLGKKGDRLTNLSKHIPLDTSPNTKSFRDKIIGYREYLIRDRRLQLFHFLWPFLLFF
jgi:hypothetical protein